MSQEAAAPQYVYLRLGASSPIDRRDTLVVAVIAGEGSVLRFAGA